MVNLLPLTLAIAPPLFNPNPKYFSCQSQQRIPRATVINAGRRRFTLRSFICICRSIVYNLLIYILLTRAITLLRYTPRLFILSTTAIYTYVVLTIHFILSTLVLKKVP